MYIKISGGYKISTVDKVWIEFHLCVVEEEFLEIIRYMDTEKSILCWSDSSDDKEGDRSWESNCKCFLEGILTYYLSLWMENGFPCPLKFRTTWLSFVLMTLNVPIHYFWFSRYTRITYTVSIVTLEEPGILLLNEACSMVRTILFPI